MIVLIVCIVVCDPPCENGVCVANDNCSCSMGFSGETCADKSKHNIIIYITKF